MRFVNNPPKFVLLLVAVIGVIVLLALGKISESAGMFFLGSVTGIGIGNGIASSRGEEVEPVFGTQRRKTQRK